MNWLLGWSNSLAQMFYESDFAAGSYIMWLYISGQLGGYGW